jgi:1-acyl-sn-glycerol-3-phosphate acyltransferase
MSIETRGVKPVDCAVSAQEKNIPKVELLPPLPHAQFAMDQLSRVFISEIHTSGDQHLNTAYWWLAHGGSVIWEPNHLSNTDGPAFLAFLRSTGMVSDTHQDDPAYAIGLRLTQDKLLNGVGLTRFAPTIPVWPPTVRPRNTQELQVAKQMNKDAVEVAGEVLRNGKQLVVFPEGTRSREGKLARGRAGVSDFHKARGEHGSSDDAITDTLIVPVAMWGTEVIHPIENKLPIRRGPIYVNVGKPISASELTSRYEHLREGQVRNQAMIDHVMIEIAHGLPERMRGEYAQSV